MVLRCNPKKNQLGNFTHIPLCLDLDKELEVYQKVDSCGNSPRDGEQRTVPGSCSLHSSREAFRLAKHQNRGWHEVDSDLACR